MQNIIKKVVSGLIAQAQTAVTAVTAKAAALGLLHSKPEVINPNITSLIAARKAHDDAKADWETDRNALKGLVKSGRALVHLSREVLKPYVGTVLNEILAGAGFVGSFRIPSKRDELVEVLQRLQSYFTDHPEHENAPLNVTAARCGTVAADIAAMVAQVASKKALVRTKKLDRDAKRTAVRFNMTTLLSELHVVLDPFSPLWVEFGFNPPGVLSVPDAPTNIIAVLIGPGAVAVKWDKAARAKNYRVFKQVVGLDEEFVFVDSGSDLDLLIDNLPAGATVKIAVSASNGSGESALSEVVTVTIPA